jgi:hypothetical protein
VTQQGSELLQACTADEFKILGALAADGHIVLAEVRHSGCIYRAPSEPVWAMMQRLCTALYPYERLRAAKEQIIFQALLKAAAASCSTNRIGQKHSIELRADVYDIAALRLLGQQHDGAWKRGKYCMELASHKVIPLQGDFHFFTAVTKREPQSEVRFVCVCRDRVARDGQRGRGESVQACALHGLLDKHWPALRAPHVARRFGDKRHVPARPEASVCGVPPDAGDDAGCRSCCTECLIRLDSVGLGAMALTRLYNKPLRGKKGATDR